MTVSLLTIFNASLVNRSHDEVKFSIYFFTWPTKVSSVLSHFKTRGSNTTSVNCLTRCKEDTVRLECVDSFRGTTHVGNLAAAPCSVSNQFLSIVTVQLVLESARQCDITFYRPSFLAGSKFSLSRELLSHHLNAVLVRSTHNEHIVNHLFGDTVSDFANSIRTGNSDNFSTKFDSFGCSSPSHVTETGKSYSLTLDVFTCSMQNVLREVKSTETSSFRTEDRTSPSCTLTGQYSSIVFASKFFVHSVHITDFTTANTNVTSRDISIRTYILPQFIHESLTETHDFSIWFSNRIEVRTTFTTTHRKSSQCVFESLLETEEFQHRKVNCLVETKSTFVRSNSTVELYAVTQVSLNFTLIVYPCHAESKDTIRFYHTFNDFCILEFRVLVVNLFDWFQHFVHRLKEFFFTWVFGFQVSHHFCYIHNKIF